MPIFDPDYNPLDWPHASVLKHCQPASPLSCMNSFGHRYGCLWAARLASLEVDSAGAQSIVA